ncbi:type II secretion system protein [Pontiellaceae bacterium B12219]|nr:type II secretion system protein [Pontiellaceae bacterium B12219]
MKPERKQSNRKRGFTLLELLVAMVIMVIAMSIAFQAFSGTVRGWKRGMEVMDGIKHGDFAMTQLVAALNSTIYFYNGKKTYAFTFEKDSNSGLPADSISFVTSSGAFMPFDSPFISGPHRLNLFIDNDDGAPALFVSALPAVANPEDEEDELEADPILVSREVQGLEILIWDDENEDWTEEWEQENSIPERIMLTIFVASEDPAEEPIAFSRVIEIPVAASVKDKLTGPSLKGTSTSSGSNNSGGNITVGPNR